MKLLQDLFGTGPGLMSLIGIAFMIGMGIWYVRFFLRKIDESSKQQEKQ
ncbi:MAG TPA: DUF3149 domain-containing protein [Rubrivivax sp.]|nr:DUF3149 domain-containing protein [Burkholderiales bacterium]HNU10731.1 DUF3149 domain-containing protein [Rubrivivax sp.]